MTIDVQILVPSTQKRHVASLRRAALAAVLAIPRRVREPALGDGAWVMAIVFVSDRRMRTLNEQYRKKDRTTDVLSFSRLGEPGFPGLPEEEPKEIGDVLISPVVAKRQAKEYRATLTEELQRLTVHGVLHLFGYDHEKNAAEARTMFRLQRKALASLTAGSRPSGARKRPSAPGTRSRSRSSTPRRRR